MKFKDEVREFCAALEVCEAARDVEELVATNKALLNQMRQDVPSWWFDDPQKDGTALEERIADKIAELQPKEELEPPR